MYDIFIDEEKNSGYLGFLVVKETPASQQMFLNIRSANQKNHSEVKFVTVNNTRIRMILPWLNIFFNHEACVGFYYRKWNKTLIQKRNLITKTVMQLKKLVKTSNLVVLMDLDSNHKNIDIQRQIRVNARIARCYHLDSKSVDMLQLTDILLQCAIKNDQWELDNKKLSKLTKKMHDRISMKKPELKRLIVWHASKQNQKRKKIRKKILID